MHSGSARLLTLACVAAMLGGCDSDRPLAPRDDDGLFSVSGGSGAPSTLASTLVPTSQIDLSWTDNSHNENGFEVHRSASGPDGTFTPLPDKTGPDVTSYSDKGLAAETQYCYKVRAFRITGKKTSYSAFSNTSCTTTPPRAPSGASASPASSSAIDVTWGDASAAEDGFRVERAASNQGPWETVTTTGPNATSVRDSWRPSEQQACYRVVAFNGHGASDPSNVDCTAPPAAPTNLQASSVVDRTIDLTWSDNSGVEGGYEVQRTTAGEPWSVVAALPPNTVSYRDEGLAGDTRYTYMVRATKDGGFSDFSNTATAVTADSPPPAPGNVEARPNSSTSVIVVWAYDPANEDGFRVERSSDGLTNWVTVGSTDRFARGLEDAGRVSEQQVWYRVFAFNGKGDSGPSNTATTVPPAAPGELVATPAAEASIDLTWRDNSNAEDGYEVQRWVCYQSYYYYPYCDYVSIVVLGPNVASYRDTGLNPGEFYQYRVLARRDGGYSTPSNEAGATATP